MADPRMNCLDMSKWSGPLTLQEAQEMQAQGIRNIKVATGNAAPGGSGQYARQQADNWTAASADVTLDAYIYLYMAGDPHQQVQQAVQTLVGYPVRRWWLDAEDTESPQLTPQQRESFLTACLTELGDKPAGIYTGRWWWPQNMANSTLFCDLPLWNSYYDGDPDEDGLPYGGWEHSAVEQYQDTTIVCGQSVDINYDKTLDEEDMNPEDKKLLDALATIMGGRDRVIHNADPSVGMDFVLGYGMEQQKLGVVLAKTGSVEEAQAAADAYAKEYNS